MARRKKAITKVKITRVSGRTPTSAIVRLAKAPKTRAARGSVASEIEKFLKGSKDGELIIFEPKNAPFKVRRPAART